MSGSTYVTLAYAIGTALLWGYAISLWIRLSKGGRS
jgi:hypothetical protein